MPYFQKTKFHSIVFSLIALVAITLSWQFSALQQAKALLILMLLISVLGIPHGALDTLFAKQHWQLSSAKGWLIFLLGYVLLAGLVVGFWLLEPMLFFMGFMVISIFHFADDLPGTTPLMARTLYGGAIIVLPTLLHQQQIAQLFSYFISLQEANKLANIMHFLAFIWSAGIIASGFICFKTNQYTSLEIASVSLLALLASPLVAFTIYFCGMHSLRHLLRSYTYLSHTTKTLKLAALTFPTLFVFITAAFCWPLLKNQATDIKMVQLLFVTLAALTVPHMLLLYLSGFTTWLKTLNHQ